MPSDQALEGIIGGIKEAFPELSLTMVSPSRLELRADPSLLRQIATFMKTEENFDHVTSVTGLDLPESDQIAVIYHLASYSDPTRRHLIVSLSVSLHRANPSVPSLTSVWPSADYHERETHEMLGVAFEGHLGLTGLLLPEDWSDIPPLRKDFKLRGR
jgi:NADH-quinone oxidoreductase subunit C